MQIIHPNLPLLFVPSCMLDFGSTAPQAKVFNLFLNISFLLLILFHLTTCLNLHTFPYQPSMADFISSTPQAKVFHLFLNSSFLLLIVFHLTTCLNLHTFYHQPTNIIIRDNSSQSPNDFSGDCNGLHRYENFEEKCIYLSSPSQCDPEGYINYLYLFYCSYGKYPVLAYTLLILWLVLLFYLLDNTTANYFRSNLEGLSRLLKLSPTISGVTLLSLGNGAPDAFSSIVSFMGTGTNAVGLNSILGCAFFMSCVVVGAISFCVGPCNISIDKWSFISDHHHWEDQCMGCNGFYFSLLDLCVPCMHRTSHS